MMRFENPELLRYIRSELRPSRVAITMTGTLAGAVLMALFIMVESDRRDLSPLTYWHNVYSATLLATSMILVLWSLLNASQAVVSERTHRTFDFWRTTRLSPLSLSIGKLLGAPLLPWLLFATALPVVLVTGLLGGVSIARTLTAFIVIGLFSIALSAVALCASMRAQDARRANLLMLAIVLFVLPNLTMSTHGQSFASAAGAWTALTPILGIGALVEGQTLAVSIFRYHVPSLLVTLAASLAVIGWCLAAMVRCIKFEPEQRSLFSPAQVVGVSVTVLLFVYAAFQPISETVRRTTSLTPEMMSQLTLESLVATGISAALACLYFTANSTLLTRDNLRQRLRASKPTLIAMQLIAPWLVTGAVALVAALLALKGYAASYAGNSASWFAVIVTYVSMTLYVVRDGLFLQWMISQRVKAPVLKGGVLIGCYYIAAFSLSMVVSGPEHMTEMLRWLAPPVANVGQAQAPAWLMLATLVPPIVTAALIAAGIFQKMRKTMQAAVLAEA